MKYIRAQYPGWESEDAFRAAPSSHCSISAWLLDLSPLLRRRHRAVTVPGYPEQQFGTWRWEVLSVSINLSIAGALVSMFFLYTGQYFLRTELYFEVCVAALAVISVPGSWLRETCSSAARRTRERGVWTCSHPTCKHPTAARVPLTAF